MLKEVTEIGFDTAVNNVDGHSSNRTFYKEKLCNGVLKTNIPHPFKFSSRI